MPRPPVVFRAKEEAVVELRRLAAAETNGDLSKMIRKLLAEAIDARRQR